MHTQGDGMQSALALLLPVITASFPIILVDEPEAFLHPPQARILGSTLARLAHSRAIQLVVATHDRHFLTGLLDADEVAVSVIRLSRDRDTSVATHLESNTLRSAWSSAALRHSNLLDGLFHRVVVVTENERDCRFYAAALEALDEETTLPIRPHDVLFISSSGKGHISALSRVLLASGVPVVASPDLDIVNDEQTIQKLFALFQGNWSDIQSTYAAATAEFRTPRVIRKNEEVLRLVQVVLGQNLGDDYTGNTKRDITNVLRVDSEWQRLKDFGVSGFRAQRGKADEFLSKLAERGIVPVHVGELERFAPEINLGKGDAWLAGALAAGAHRRPPVRLHLSNILTSAGFPMTLP
nr:AAA family ATPase [Pseudarthrobacter sp. GA104]